MALRADVPARVKAPKSEFRAALAHWVTQRFILSGVLATTKIQRSGRAACVQ
jgi:hypothetical protein